MFYSKYFKLVVLISSFFLINCSVHLSKIDLDGNYQDYSIAEQKTVNVGSAMLSKFNYKNSCYDYVALIDYETPKPGVMATTAIKKGTQYPACFHSPSKANYVFLKGVHAYENIFLAIDENGFIGEKGGWYNLANAGVRMFQASWTKEQLFALSKKTYYPGFDSRNERLIYLGMTDEKIRIGYREDNYNSSKPDESQDIIYDLSDEDTIAYLDYTLKILNADNTKITFVIVSDGSSK